MNLRKKLIIASAIVFVVNIFTLKNNAFAIDAIPQSSNFQYKMLETLPGFFAQNSVVDDLPTFILAIYKFGIWTVGIAGLFMLVVGGFVYMTSAGNNAAVSSAKEIIRDALLGIVAAMAAYLVMYVINPDLTSINIAFTKATVSEEEWTGGTAEADKGNSSTSGGCMKIVNAARLQKAAGWIYDQSGKGTMRGKTISGIRYTDCSDFVYSAYKTAGCKSPGGTTSEMYPRAIPFSDSSYLKAGDAIVNKSGGHVVLCVDDGCSQIIHSPGRKTPQVTIKNGSEAANKKGTFWSSAKVIKAGSYCGGC